MLHIRVESDPDLAALGGRWQSLEGRADGSFFQGWAWTGCLAAERFPRPVLVSAERGDETVALGLFNVRRGPGGERLCLGETGDGADGHDAVFIEHNGLLLDRREEPGLEAACLQALLDRPGRWARRLVLGGLGARSLAAAGAVPGARLRLRQARAAPFVDLAALRAAGRPYLDALSANARQQLRRSRRRHEAGGPLVLRQAADAREALAFLDEMVGLHQAAWTGRGRPGAFADPWVLRFHRTLLGRAGCAAATLQRVSAGGRGVGVLYNLRHRGRVVAYQGGFAYADAIGEPQRKPGLTCHHLAIEAALADGADAYDLLAGDARYKRSLATDVAALGWAELAGRASLPGLLGAAGDLAGLVWRRAGR